MSGTRGKGRGWLRWVLLGLAVLVLLPLGGLAVLLATLDLDAQKPRIAAAVQQATGRALTLSGPISLKPSLVPTLAVEGVALANMPGGSRPQMLEMRRAELELALLPLLSRRVEVRRLVLLGPDILLETDPQGRPNWAFAPEGGTPSPAPSPTAPAEPAGPGYQLAVQRVVITEGRLTWRNGATGQSRVLAVPRFEASAQNGPIGFGGELALDGTAFRLSGETGPLAALFGPPPAAPWPVKLALDAAGAHLAVDGSLAQPLAGRGWRGNVAAQVPALEALAPLVPGLALPPLHGIDLAATVAEPATANPAGLPEISGLRLTIGESALDTLLPGLKLAAASLQLPQPDQDAQIEARGSLGALPFTLAGSLGAPAPLLQGQPGPWPLDLTLTAANAEARVQGVIARLAQLAGVDLALSLKVPSLEPFAALAGSPLPPVTDIALETRLAERDPGFANGAVLRGLRLTSSAFDAAGDLTLQTAPRPGLRGALASDRIDLDALKPPAKPGQPAAPTAAPGPAPADGRVIPDLPLPVEALKGLDAGLRWQIGQLRAGGVAIRQVQLVLESAEGRAQLHLPTATLPGGQFAARLNADTTQDPPRVAGAVYSEGLDLPPLLAALGAPANISGRLEVDIDLAGHGRDLRAVAGSTDGHAALALTSGHIDQGQGSMLSRAIGEFRQALPQVAGLAQGRLEVACAAARFAVQDGIARSQALLVDGSLGKVGGGGSANLRDETLALRLELDLALPIPGVNLVRIRAPVPVTGRFAAPRADYAAAAAGGALGTAEGLLRTPGNLADGVLGALGGPRNLVPGAGGNLPDCGAVLAA
ncbi:AsmA family protein, partial [Siccirubricoccus sp. KC 17139]